MMMLRQLRHHRVSRLRALVVAAVLMSVFVPAAGTMGASAATKPTLAIGLTPGDVGNLNPALNSTQALDSLAYQALTYLKPDNTFKNSDVLPSLATSWKYIGKGNTKFQFTLRKDAKFSDGTPVNAATVIPWLNYFDSAPGNPHNNLKVDTIKAISKYTVEIDLLVPCPDLPWFMAQNGLFGAIASPAAVANPTELSTATYGAGPYMLDPANSTIGSSYTYVPNPYYFDKSKQYYSKITVQVISSPTAMLQALQAGQIQVSRGDYSTVVQAHASGIKVWARIGQTAQIYLTDLTGFNTPALGNQQVRQAMNMAVNRGNITQALFGGLGAQTSEIVTSDGGQNYSKMYPYNPVKAKQMLAAAGYPNGFTWDVICLSAASGNANQPLAEAIAADLQKIGITTNITVATTSTAFVQGFQSGNYGGYAVAAGSALTWLYGAQAWANPSVNNKHGWVDGPLQYLVQKQLVSDDPTSVADQLMKRATTIAVSIPIARIDTLWYSAKNVGGLDGASVSSGGVQVLANAYPTK